jgi:hypothetical protein
MMPVRITDLQRFVNMVRLAIGLDELYYKKTGDRRRPAVLDYIELEALSRRADPECLRCEGAGYRIGAAQDGRIKCQCVRPDG